METTQRVRVHAFGRWSVTVDGEEAPGIRSRLSRELLLRMSLQDEPSLRETLIDELQPHENDMTRGRRRLTRELSRIQSLIDVPIWDASLDIVGIAPEVGLGSDLRDFLAGSDLMNARQEPHSERQRVAEVLALAHQGKLLATHLTPWALRQQNLVERLEVRLIRRSIKLGDGSNRLADLELTRRWTELEPYCDAAHALLLRLMVAQFGPMAAADHYHEVARRYQTELGTPPPRSVADALEAEVTDVANTDLDLDSDMGSTV